MTAPAKAGSKAIGAPLAAPDGGAHAQGSDCYAMPAELHHCLHLTLEERAGLARLGTAALDAHSLPEAADWGSHFA